MIDRKILPIAIILGLALDGLALTRKKLDFVVGVNGDFKAAKAAAGKASGRFVMFFPDGEYDIGSLTGDANQMTTFSSPNVSFIGQSEDKTVLFNKSPNEGISITATLNLNGAHNAYMQDLSVMNKAVYGNTAQYNVTGRHVAICERSDKVIYKNVRLLSTQDTYYTKGTRTYWEGGQIHGTTDFICGNGDVFFHKVLLWEMKVSAITAPATTTPWGYVFDECTIDGTVSGFNLGRSWGTARAAFLKTTMKKLPSAGGWGADMNSAPQLFAEYRSVTAAGAPVDMSKRVKSTILTDAAAAKFTVANVLAGSDNWQPDVLVKQVPAPVVALAGTKLTWSDDANALCWVLFRNGKYLDNVTVNSYDASSIAKGDVLTVRAANSMGGLGAGSSAVVIGSTTSLPSQGPSGIRHGYDPQAKVLRFSGDLESPLEVSLHRLDGSLVQVWNLESGASGQGLEIGLGGLASASYVLNYSFGGTLRSAVLVLR